MKLMRVLRACGLLVLGLACYFFTVYPLLGGATLGEVVTQYSYFTDQVVTLCGTYLVLLAFAGFGVKKLKRVVYNPYLKVGVTTYIVGVGLIYYIGIVPFAVMGADGLFAGELQSVCMHAGVPAVMLAVFFLTPFTGEVNYIKSLYLLIYPVLYLVYLGLFTAATGVGIYPFLRMEYVGSKSMMMVCVTAIVVGMLLVGYGMIRLYNRRADSSRAQKAELPAPQ